MKKLRVLSVFFLAVLGAVLLGSAFVQPVKAAVDCGPGAYRRTVFGDGAVATGNFSISGIDAPGREQGGLRYHVSQSHILRANLHCLEFSNHNQRVNFTGVGRVWNGTEWETGYAVTGYAEDLESGDTLSVMYCKVICYTYINPGVTEGEIVILP